MKKLLVKLPIPQHIVGEKPKRQHTVRLVQPHTTHGTNAALEPEDAGKTPHQTGVRKAKAGNHTLRKHKATDRQHHAGVRRYCLIRVIID